MENIHKMNHPSRNNKLSDLNHASNTNFLSNDEREVNLENSFTQRDSHYGSSLGASAISMVEALAIRLEVVEEEIVRLQKIANKNSEKHYILFRPKEEPKAKSRLKDVTELFVLPDERRIGFRKTRLGQALQMEHEKRKELLKEGGLELQRYLDARSDRVAFADGLILGVPPMESGMEMKIELNIIASWLRWLLDV